MLLPLTVIIPVLRETTLMDTDPSRLDDPKLAIERYEDARFFAAYLIDVLVRFTLQALISHGHDVENGSGRCLAGR